MRVCQWHINRWSKKNQEVIALLQHPQHIHIDKGLSIFYRGLMKPYLNASEVAKLLDVDRATIIRWIRRGVVKGAQRPEGARRWRIPLSSYEALAKDESR